MRKSRLTERRKRELKKSLMIKPLVGLYLLFLFLSSITGSTEAAFNDVEEISASLKVGWEIDEDEKWDKSSLSFDGMEVGGDCDRIYAYVKNGGDGDMEVPWGYQVIKISQGNDGDVIHEGETPLIDSGESAELAYEGELENGKYKFKFVRPEGHPGGDSGGFSSGITLTNCEEQGNEEDDDQGDPDGPPDKCSEDFPGNPPKDCEEQQNSESIDETEGENVNESESGKETEQKSTQTETEGENEDTSSKEKEKESETDSNTNEESTKKETQEESTQNTEQETNKSEQEETENKVANETDNTDNQVGDNHEDQDN